MIIEDHISQAKFERAAKPSVEGTNETRRGHVEYSTIPIHLTHFQQNTVPPLYFRILNLSHSFKLSPSEKLLF